MLAHYGAAIVGLAAIVAALLYLARQLARLATAVRFVANHPAEHRKLAEATDASTRQLRILAEEVRQLALVERSRRRW